MEFKPRGLRFEITVSLALLVSAAVGLVGLVVFKYAQREMIQLQIANGLTITSALQQELAGYPEGVDIQALVDAFARTGFKIVVVDRQGNTLAESGDWAWGSGPGRAELMETLSVGEVRTSSGRAGFLFFGPDPTLSMAVPLRQGPRVMAAAGLYSSLDELRAAWFKARWLIILYLALDTLIIVLFGSYLLSIRLVRPLAGMLDRVKKLADGEYEPGEPAEAVKGTEIGELEAAFEDMAARLHDNRLRLESNIVSLEKAQGDLVRSEKMASVGRLAAGVAHELGNPLSSIQGFIHLLNRNNISEEEKADFIKRIQSELKRMDAIIRLLLDYARPARSETGPVDLNRLASAGLELLKVQPGFRGLEITRNLTQGLPCARAEENKLIQVLLNLLRNAVQAMEVETGSNGRLTIETGRGEYDDVFISVADTGTGIAAEDLERIFDPFFTRKEPGQGAGLGLAVSRSIIESFGGRIRVSSVQGRGSTFTVFLPVDE